MYQKMIVALVCSLLCVVPTANAASTFRAKPVNVDLFLNSTPSGQSIAEYWENDSVNSHVLRAYMLTNPSAPHINNTSAWNAFGRNYNHS